MKILNMTGKPATPEQLAEGVIEPSEEDIKEICAILDGKAYDFSSEFWQRVDRLVAMAISYGAEAVMLENYRTGFSHALYDGFEEAGIEVATPIYVRYATKTINEDGEYVETLSEMKHYSFHWRTV